MADVIGRKVEANRWESRLEPDGDEVPADAVTDLRTRANALSFWRCGTTASVVPEDVVLAMATGPNVDRLDRIDIAWIELEALQSASISVRFTPGETRIARLRDRHCDACNLDAFRLVELARVTLGAWRSGNRRRFTKSDVRQALAGAVRSDKITLAELPEKIRAEVQRELVSAPPGS